MYSQLNLRSDPYFLFWVCDPACATESIFIYDIVWGYTAPIYSLMALRKNVPEPNWLPLLSCSCWCRLWCLPLGQHEWHVRRTMHIKPAYFAEPLWACVCVCLCVCALQWKHAHKILKLLHARVQICNSCLDQQQLQCAHLYGECVVNTPSRDWLSTTLLLPDNAIQLHQQTNWSLLYARTCATYLATKTSYHRISTSPPGHEDYLETLPCYWMCGSTLIIYGRCVLWWQIMWTQPSD